MLRFPCTKCLVNIMCKDQCKNLKKYRSTYTYLYLISEFLGIIFLVCFTLYDKNLLVILAIVVLTLSIIFLRLANRKINKFQQC